MFTCNNLDIFWFQYFWEKMDAYYDNETFIKTLENFLWALRDTSEFSETKNLTPLTHQIAYSKGHINWIKTN